jgi:hypothetical protein
MPFVFVIIGIIVIVGVGGYFFRAPENTPIINDTPVVRTEDTPPIIEVATETETATEPAPNQTPSQTPTAGRPVTTPTPAPTLPPTPPAVAVNAFKNGTYEVTTDYVVPSRARHDVIVSLTIVNDIVTDSTLSYGGDKDNTSTNYQNRFAAAYKSEVVGKKLSDISLVRVGGASLTTRAFNEAVTEISATAVTSR